MIPGGWELIAILAVLVLLFGAKKLPGAARSIGQSMRIFKAETKGMQADDHANPGQPHASATPAALPAPLATPAPAPSVPQGQPLDPDYR